MSRVVESRCWMVFALMVAFAVDARGTSIVERSFGDLCASAELIFCGTVSAVESRRDGADGEIHTFTTFGDLEWIEGNGDGDSYVLRTLGGSVAGESLVVQGIPRFVVGDRYVLFVRGDSGGRPAVCPVVGLRQGCFRVVTMDEGGAQLVRTYEGRPITGQIDGDVVVPKVSARDSVVDRSDTPMTLEIFVAAVRSAVRRARTRDEDR